MIRTLLATTALAAMMASATFAQETPTPAPDAVAPAGGAVAPAQGLQGYSASAPEQVLATSVLGKTVYTGSDEQGEAIGDVNDVVINASGGAEALVIGVGGFLGIGEKDVAINFDRVSWSDRDGQRIIVVSATKEELEAAPQFERTAVMDGAVATGSEQEQSTGQTVTPPVITDENAETEIPATGTTPQMTDPDAPVVDSGTATSAAPASDPDLKPVDPSMLSTEKLIGTPVKVADDTQIGKIGDVILDKSGKVEAYVIDIGGFLGIGAKPVAMSAQSVQIVADAKGATTIYSPFTKEQLEEQPAYDAAAYKANPRGLILSTPAN